MEAIATAEARARAAGRLPGWIFDAVGRPAFWLAVLGSLLGLCGALVLRQGAPPVPPIYSTLPAFQLTDHDGRAFTRAHLEGRVWIANFVFTRCPTVCSALSERMSALQVRLKNTGGDVRLLSLSVDPGHDTPAVLREYAAKFRWQPWKWTWLTGPLGEIERVVVQGFKMALDRNADAPDDILSITHGSKLVLVDRWGRLRGFYDADDADEERLLRDVAVIANLERYKPRTAVALDAAGGPAPPGAPSVTGAPAEP